LTTATSAMGAAVANLTKAWTTAGQGHQQLEGDDDVWTEAGRKIPRAATT